MVIASKIAKNHSFHPLYENLSLISRAYYYYQQKLTTPFTSLPPSEFTQLQALCGTEHRSFVPPIDLNRPDVVSLKRGRPIIRSFAKKKSLSSGSRSAAPSKVTNYCSYRSVRDPWPTTSMYLVRLVRTHIYDFLFIIAFNSRSCQLRIDYLMEDE